MTDKEFASFLRLFPRERSEGEVHEAERVRDKLRGLYVPHGGSVHHVTSESRH